MQLVFPRKEPFLHAVEACVIGQRSTASMRLRTEVRLGKEPYLQVKASLCSTTIPALTRLRSYSLHPDQSSLVRY